ncbi:MAG: alkaline phosphatase [Phycisphaerae bacterium]|jgi:alkaline phosphatase
MKTVKYLTLTVLLLQSFVFASSADYPKNIILIIVDGGGINHINAADYYTDGKKGSQLYEKFPVKLSVTTYPAGGSYDPKKAEEDFGYVKSGYTDSAAAATALATGVKTNNGSLGIDTDENIVEKCEKLGMSTGVITTVPLSHATPAGFVAHKHSRYGYEDIANEMINESALEVIFGCGNPLFDDSGKKLSKPGELKYVGGRQTWNSLIEGSAGSDADGDGIADKWTLIQSKQDFINLADGQTPKRVIGVAQAAETLQEKRSGKSSVPFDAPLNKNVPNLAEMTKAALNVLDNDHDGFFIMIEAGAVDWASHWNNSARMIEEMIDFDGAADAVINWVETKSDWDNTLVIITADHQTGYLTGPKSDKNKATVVKNSGKRKMPKMKWHSHDHINAPVFLFAKGQGSELFARQIKGKDPVYGSYIDNTDIPKVLFTILEQKTSAQK